MEPVVNGPDELEALWRSWNVLGQPLGFRLKVARQAQGLTQGDVAVILGVSRGYVSMIECGSRALPICWVAELAIAYGLPAEPLISEMLRRDTGRSFGVRDLRWRERPTL